MYTLNGKLKAILYWSTPVSTVLACAIYVHASSLSREQRITTLEEKAQSVKAADYLQRREFEAVIRRLDEKMMAMTEEQRETNRRLQAILTQIRNRLPSE